MFLYSVILAHCEDKCFKSNTAMPLLRLCGKPLLEHLKDTAEAAGSVKSIAFCGHCGDKIKEYFSDSMLYSFCNTGSFEDALKCGIENIEHLVDKNGTVMVLSCDTPLLTAQTLKNAVDMHRSNENAVTVISMPDESKEFSNAYIFNKESLIYAVQNAYAADKNGGIAAAAEYLRIVGKNNGTYFVSSPELLKITDRIALSKAEKILNRRNAERLMLGGVSLIDPDTTYIECDVAVGADTVIYPGTTLRGKTIIGSGCTIGPSSIIENTEIGDDTSVISSMTVKCKIGSGTTVGPFAYIRPDSKISDNVKIGDFVEIKNSEIGSGTKVSHLTYVGDSDVGKNVNFGCGTVTVNYDGKKKHRTKIGDNAFIGCNTNLVAPVSVKDGAYTAAGSTITSDVPAASLGIARARQTNKEGWVKKRQS